ncbi:type II toxin-antitoxin system PemK/MazF family toxin [Xylocopilactobacillus apis]|nr:type II toxin-antitoxin system PemK/MazF family toxin [Xylocopilactobacillus apis]
MAEVIYNQGDIVWINFNPTKGHEQNARRPAIICTI